jgi:fumarylpyruvate hydrolase
MRTASVSDQIISLQMNNRVELVLAIGKAGVQIPVDVAEEYIVAYGVGLDLTRRDLQRQAKAAGAPWETAKALDQGAPMATLVRREEVNLGRDARIRCSVNGSLRQDGRLNQLIWSIPEIIAHISSKFTLQAGDLIFTGTPAGVGPLVIGDEIRAEIDGLPELQFRIVERDDYTVADVLISGSR